MALGHDNERWFRSRIPWRVPGVVPNERVVSTGIFEAIPDVEAVVTNTFTERDGRTTLTILVHHPNQENRDGHINSGMEGSMNEAMDHLEQVAISLR